MVKHNKTKLLTLKCGIKLNIYKFCYVYSKNVFMCLKIYIFVILSFLIIYNEEEMTICSK